MKNTLKKTLLMAVMALMLTFTVGTVVSTAVPVTVEAASTRTKMLKKADKIIKKQTNEDDSKATKLKKLFNYMRNTVTYKRDTARLGQIPSEDGWTDTFALEMMTDLQGDCYHYAAMYAALAQRATGYTTRVVVGTTCGFDKNRKNTQSHAWVEIKISKKWYIFDVNMDLYGKTTKGKTVKALTYYKKLRTNDTMKQIYCKYKKVKNYSVKF